jgi:hypothetical protein
MPAVWAPGDIPHLPLVPAQRRYRLALFYVPYYGRTVTGDRRNASIIWAHIDRIN